MAVERSPAPAAGLPIARGVAPARMSPRRAILRRFLRHRLAVLGAVIIALLAVAALAAPLVATHDPNAVDLFAPQEGPSEQHRLGTDQVGRDVYSRVVYGSRVSLSVGLVSVSIYLVIGTVLGAISGYYGGIVDSTIQRLTDTVLCFPGLIIIIAAVSLVGPSIYNVMFVIGLLSWPSICRLVRAEFLSLREQQFVEAARASGASDMRIIFRHLLPNTFAPLIVASTFGVALAILTEAGLSFLGLGVQPPTASWGNMINAAQSASVLQGMPWLWIPPGLTIAVSVLSINFVGDGLRDALDPRMKLN